MSNIIRKIYKCTYKKEEQLCIARYQAYGCAYLENRIKYPHYEISSAKEFINYNDKIQTFDFQLHIEFEERKYDQC